MHDVYIESGTVALGNHDLSVWGNWYNTVGVTGLRSTGTVTFNGSSGDQTVQGVTAFYNLTVNKSGQTLFVEDSLIINSELTINNGTLSSGTATLTIGDDWTNNGTYQGSGTVIFSGTNVIHTVSGFANTTFGSVRVDGTNNTFEYNSQVALLSDLTINSGTFRVAGVLPLSLNVPGHLTIGEEGFLNATLLQTLTVGGDWQNNGLFATGLNEVIFSGTTAQTLSGETNFYNVEKSGGGLLSLTDSCTVTGTLTLTDGYIHTTDTSMLLLAVDGSIAGGSANSYVDGPLTHAVSVDAVLGEFRLFPFGSNGKYRPVTLSIDLLGTANTVYYRGELHEGPPPVRTLPLDIHHVSQVRYCSINQSALLPIGFTVNEATVAVTYNDDDGVDVPSELRLVKSNGLGDWIDIGGSGSGLTGYVTSDIFTSFSDFALSSSTDNNPLPIELLTLTARPQNRRVKVAWKTASETDNSHFVVERTANGKDYTTVATVLGAGTSEEERTYQTWDNQPLSGQSYYRLKQIDFDGEYTYSRPVSVYLPTEQVSVRLYPNPASREATGVVQGLGDNAELWVRLTDPTGQICQYFCIPASHTTSRQFVLPELDRHPPGMYAVVIQSENFYWSGKLLIE